MAQHFAPEDVSGATLATQLADDLASLGMQVTFLTAAPSYPLGKVFPGHRNSLYSTEERGGVRIIRTWSYITPSKSTLSRLVNYSTFSASAFLAGLASGHYDVIFSYSPPLSLGISAWWISWIKKIPWILRVEDLYPDAAIAAGVLRNKSAIRFFHWLERLIYRKATHISLISEGFRKNLIAKGIESNKLSVTPVWADPDEIHPGEKQNEFANQHGLTDKFVILYAGNLGQTSAFDEILGAAEQLRSVPQIHFLLVGEGIRKADLEHRVREKSLSNVQFLPYQNRETVSAMLAAADVCLVSLNPSSSAYSLPSKTFTYMAGSRPILSISPESSEIASLVKSGDCGINVKNGELARLVDAIMFFYNNPETVLKMGINGRKTLIEKFSRRVCAEQFFRVITHYAQ